ncbi:LysM-like peptidoglycan-binding domain-containing protein [Enterobacter sp. Bisph1]|uniref:LysM-like peptidoglycan-binding domain-containing protein n=1 Tax=Enterobacter sp. Bisph1 TaxID=1274399 RepID=UPI00057C2B64|nr:LysM-like peptidoglycan-binding domain-containing protein [Enterobacter sp. Bisph1]
MPGRFELKPTLVKIWHAPDHFRLMDPLPLMHRRGLILAALLVVIGILLPSTDDNSRSTTPSGAREAQLNLPNSADAPPPPVVSEQEASVPSAEESIQQQQPEAEPVQQQRQPVAQNTLPASSGIEQQWRTYRVEEGKTLAQLFRDHNLPPTDVYAMAKVEGDGKPLSTLKSGQMVKIRQNASGVVTGLTIETGGQPVLFTRQPDGNFIRAR